MYLEPNRDDRDYLYGRLLALADNFEESVLRKQGVKDRPTNAIKLMSNCGFGKVAGLEMVFVRSGSAHDEGCLSHLKNCRNPNCDFRGRLKTK